MISLLNFGHPLTEQNLQEIEDLAGEFIDKVYYFDVSFMIDEPFDVQMSELIGEVINQYIHKHVKADDNRV